MQMPFCSDLAQGDAGCRELNRRLCIAKNPLLAGLFRKTYRAPKA